MPLSSIASTSGLPRLITLPTTTTSGRSSSWSRLVALDHLDAERRELRAHRRIDVAVGARDAMARGAGQRGDAAHEGAADAEDVHVHGQEPGPRATPTR